MGIADNAETLSRSRHSLDLGIEYPRKETFVAPFRALDGASFRLCSLRLQTKLNSFATQAPAGKELGKNDHARGNRTLKSLCSPTAYSLENEWQTYKERTKLGINLNAEVSDVKPR